MKIKVVQTSCPAESQRRIAYAVVASRRTAINSSLTVAFVDADGGLAGLFEDIVGPGETVRAETVLRTLQFGGAIAGLEDPWLRDRLLAAAREQAPRTGDVVPPRVQAERYVELHLAALCSELLDLKQRGVLREGATLRTLATLSSSYVGHNAALAEAERLVVMAALEAGACV